MVRPSGGDIALWAIVTASAWTIGGIVCAIILYQNVVPEPTTTPTPEHLKLLPKILLPWALLGIIIGVVGLLRFVALAAAMGPIRAYPVHVVQMSIVSIVIGLAVGVFLYSMFEPPEGVVLRALVWRILLCPFVALVVNNIALRTIGKLGRNM